jgi:hypothetical protein
LVACAKLQPKVSMQTAMRTCLGICWITLFKYL